MFSVFIPLLNVNIDAIKRSGSAVKKNKRRKCEWINGCFSTALRVKVLVQTRAPRTEKNEAALPKATSSGAVASNLNTIVDDGFIEVPSKRLKGKNSKNNGSGSRLLPKHQNQWLHNKSRFGELSNSVSLKSQKAICWFAEGKH